MVRLAFSSSICSLISLFALLVFSSVGIVSPAVGQTPAQIEAFLNLTPEQQRAAMEALRGGQQNQVRTDRVIDFPQTVQPRTTREDERSRWLTEGPPRLQANDTILINLELKRFEDQHLPAPPPESDHGNFA